MVLPNELHPLQLGAGSASAYQIEQSLRFDGSASLSRSLGTTSSSWTVSFWTKTALNDNHDGYWFNTSQTAIYMDTSSGAASDRRWKIRDNSTGTLVVSNALVRDPSAWYHVVYKCDGSNRRLYINNSLDAGFTFSGSTTLSGSSLIGGYYTGSGSKIEAYIAEFHLVDGTALDPTDFGEYDDNGVWRPIEYTGSHGTQGFYLKFDPSAANGIGHDHSGNGNNWTPTGFVTTGTGTDVMSDTPTSNFATLNPLNGYQTGGLLAPTYSNANLTVTPQVNSGNNSRPAYTTLARSPGNGGVWRWELVVNNNTNSAYGIMALDEDTGAGGYGPWWVASGLGGTLGVAQGASGSLQEQHATISAGDVITIVVSFDDNEIGWYINGTRTGFYNNCNFSNYDQLVPIFKESTRTQTPCTFDVNFGQKAFQYTTSGDSWGDLSLLPAPTIKDGTDYFNTVLYTGNGSLSTDTQAITGVGFQPDFLWVKGRSVTSGGIVWDAVRGVSNRLATHVTNAEDTSGDWLSSFDTDGFTAKGNANNVNATGQTFVAWNWKANGSGSSNTDGTITSTVSANPTAGFSIVGYEGNNTAGATVGHGLGVQPSMIIIKNRDNSAGRWIVYHSVLGGTKYIRLDSTGGTQTDSSVFNDTAPSSTTFTLGTNYYVNGNTENIIAYCFAEVENYSRIGSYVGNGSSDGPFVYCGFRPSWVMIKDTSVTGNSWYISDNKRNTYNVVNGRLMANLSNGESTSVSICDFTANGFKIRTNDSGWNTSGTTYIFASFSENPFGGSGVSPATAR